MFPILHPQSFHKPMTSKPFPPITFIEEEQAPMPLNPYGNPDVATKFVYSNVFPKYVTDVATVTLISVSEEFRKMFLTEVTITCLEARRHLYVVVIRYMEQDCMGPNHV